ncbi:MAG: DUF938 domain-containing protein [Methylococcaceae bacterium]|nr:DUF938 domain-containing protein [Methylococcaceae bacterium]
MSTDYGNDNITDPVHLDLTDPETWFNPGKAKSFAAMFCINIFQVAPISIADGMMECAANLLSAGSRYFCESFFGHPCPTSGKNHATANACGCPSRPESLVRYPARG